MTENRPLRTRCIERSQVREGSSDPGNHGLLTPQGLFLRVSSVLVDLRDSSSGGRLVKIPEGDPPQHIK
jgi:hypothetical protein